MKLIGSLILVASLGVSSSAYADNFDLSAIICYAATDMLKKDTGFLSEYSMLHDHLGAIVLPKLGIDHARARTKGKSEILGGARKLGITPYETSLRFYDKICRPVFIQ